MSFKKCELAFNDNMTANDVCLWFSSQGCESLHQCRRRSMNLPTTPAERRRASLSVLGASSQPAYNGNRKRSSAASCRSAPVTDNVA